MSRSQAGGVETAGSRVVLYRELETSGSGVRVFRLDAPVIITIDGPAGTGKSSVARALAKRLGQSVVADNRPGAGGLMGYAQAAHATADGYTVILTGIPLYLLPLFSEVSPPPFDPQKDFTPIARVARVPQAVVVSADSPYKTLHDLLDETL